MNTYLHKRITRSDPYFSVGKNGDGNQRYHSDEPAKDLGPLRVLVAPVLRGYVGI